jgi:hypothetical protein
LNAITELFTGVDEEVPLSVFEIEVYWLSGRSNTRGSPLVSKEKTKDASSRLAEKTGGRKLLDRLHVHNEQIAIVLEESVMTGK